MSRIVRSRSLEGSRIVRAHVLEKDGEATKALIEAHAVRDHALDDLSDSVRDLAAGMARRIVAKELAADPTTIASIAAEAIGKLKRANALTIRVHPLDAETIAAMQRQILASSGITAPLQLESDPSLSRGDCVVVSNLGTIDARIDTKIAQFVQALELSAAKPKP